MEADDPGEAGEPSDIADQDHATTAQEIQSSPHLNPRLTSSAAIPTEELELPTVEELGKLTSAKFLPQESSTAAARRSTSTWEATTVEESTTASEETAESAVTATTTTTAAVSARTTSTQDTEGKVESTTVAVTNGDSTTEDGTEVFSRALSNNWADHESYDYYDFYGSTGPSLPAGPLNNNWAEHEDYYEADGWRSEEGPLTPPPGAVLLQARPWGGPTPSAQRLTDPPLPTPAALSTAHTQATARPTTARPTKAVTAAPSTPPTQGSSHQEAGASTTTSFQVKVWLYPNFDFKRKDQFNRLACERLRRPKLCLQHDIMDKLTVSNRQVRHLLPQVKARKRKSRVRRRCGCNCPAGSPGNGGVPGRDGLQGAAGDPGPPGFPGPGWAHQYSS